MARSYLFQCPRCGFQATVAGGEQRGYLCRVVTIECRSCRQLYDAPTRLRVPVSRESPARDLWRLMPGRIRSRPSAQFELRVPFSPGNQLDAAAGSGKSVWVDVPLRCPVSRWHQVREWTAPGKCPRCRTFLEHSTVPYRLWE